MTASSSFLTPVPAPSQADEQDEWSRAWPGLHLAPLEWDVPTTRVGMAKLPPWKLLMIAADLHPSSDDSNQAMARSAISKLRDKDRLRIGTEEVRLAAIGGAGEPEEQVKKEEQEEIPAGMMANDEPMETQEDVQQEDVDGQPIPISPVAALKRRPSDSLGHGSPKRARTDASTPQDQEQGQSSSRSSSYSPSRPPRFEDDLSSPSAPSRASPAHARSLDQEPGGGQDELSGGLDGEEADEEEEMEASRSLFRAPSFTPEPSPASTDPDAAEDEAQQDDEERAVKTEEPELEMRDAPEAEIDGVVGAGAAKEEMELDELDEPKPVGGEPLSTAAAATTAAAAPFRPALPDSYAATTEAEQDERLRLAREEGKRMLAAKEKQEAELKANAVQAKIAKAEKEKEEQKKKEDEEKEARQREPAKEPTVRAPTTSAASATSSSSATTSATSANGHPPTAPRSSLSSCTSSHAVNLNHTVPRALSNTWTHVRVTHVPMTATIPTFSASYFASGLLPLPEAIRWAAATKSPGVLLLAYASLATATEALRRYHYRYPAASGSSVPKHLLLFLILEHGRGLANTQYDWADCEAVERGRAGLIKERWERGGQQGTAISDRRSDGGAKREEPRRRDDDTVPERRKDESHDRRNPPGPSSSLSSSRKEEPRRESLPSSAATAPRQSPPRPGAGEGKEAPAAPAKVDAAPGPSKLTTTTVTSKPGPVAATAASNGGSGTKKVLSPPPIAPARAIKSPPIAATSSAKGPVLPPSMHFKKTATSATNSPVMPTVALPLPPAAISSSSRNGDPSPTPPPAAAGGAPAAVGRKKGLNGLKTVTIGSISGTRRTSASTSTSLAATANGATNSGPPTAPPAGPAASSHQPQQLTAIKGWLHTDPKPKQLENVPVAPKAMVAAAAAAAASGGPSSGAGVGPLSGAGVGASAGAGVGASAGAGVGAGERSPPTGPKGLKNNPGPK